MIIVRAILAVFCASCVSYSIIEIMTNGFNYNAILLIVLGITFFGVAVFDSDDLERI